VTPGWVVEALDVLGDGRSGDLSAWEILMVYVLGLEKLSATALS
jgi:hypothetical protein